MALVAGILQLALGGAHHVAALTAYRDFGDPFGIAFTLLEYFGGGVLVYVWFAGKREPRDALGAGAFAWVFALAVPFFMAPAAALLAMVSPAGVALTLARVGVLMVLVRGTLAAARQQRLLRFPRVPE